MRRPHEAADREVEAGRAELALVVAVGREVVGSCGPRPPERARARPPGRPRRCRAGCACTSSRPASPDAGEHQAVADRGATASGCSASQVIEPIVPGRTGSGTCSAACVPRQLAAPGRSRPRCADRLSLASDGWQTWRGDQHLVVASRRGRGTRRTSGGRPRASSRCTTSYSPSASCSSTRVREAEAPGLLVVRGAVGDPARAGPAG